MNKNMKQDAALAIKAINAGMNKPGITVVTNDKPVSKEVTKQDVMDYIGQFTFVSVSYSGHEKTFHIRGIQAKDAELATLKAFPKMEFKTTSDTNPYSRKPQVKEYFFNNKGEFTNTPNVSNLVFQCMARDSRNARRKYGNFVSEAIAAVKAAGTGKISN